MKIYKNAPAVSFPLGGIGTGSIGLAADGRLIDWELHNRPNRLSYNGFSHFAVKAQKGERIIDCRVLQGDTTFDYSGGIVNSSPYDGVGFGHSRGGMAGMPHFESTEMHAFYPIADIYYEDRHFPGKVHLTAFNPFIPMNSKDSSLPCAFFDFEIENTGETELLYSLAFTCNNPFGEKKVNRETAVRGYRSVEMTSAAYEPDDPRFGNAVITACCDDTVCQESWFRGSWFDELTTFWREFSSPLPLKSRSYPEPSDALSEPATLCSRVSIKPGERAVLRFLITWYVPTFEKYWDAKKPRWKNYYATLFDGARRVSEYCLDRYEALRGDTFLFRDALMNSSLPEEVLDAIQGNLAILKSTACLRLEGGTFYGWEGVSQHSGSCEGTCSHVWNYAYALPFLFPELERSVREAEYKYCLAPSGKLSFRLMLPPGSPPSSFRACADGQMGAVIKTYREWKLSGDDGFLMSHWEKLKNVLAYAWSLENEDRWDAKKTGVLQGRQHHTLDMELFGASAWLEGLYLAALKAAAVMAEYLDDRKAYDEYTELFERGKRYLNCELFNGSYFIHRINLSDKSIIDSYEIGETVNSGTYWNEEENEIKYQIGDGCEIDQAVAAWHGDLLGLGEIYDPDKRKAALQSIYRLNYKSMRDVANPCRVFSMDDERGVIICSWDEAEKKPKIPLPYAEETMCGFEYAAACNMLQCGMEKEAREIVGSIRQRYDGVKRNPWAEMECGASYARSMASYSLLPAYSGFMFDIPHSFLGFAPLRTGTYFWSAAKAWGTAEYTEKSFTLKVLYGTLELKRLYTPHSDAKKVFCRGRSIDFSRDGKNITFDVFLSRNDTLTVSV